jgi:hypothetical protein
MANSQNVRIQIEDHEEGTRLALIISASKQVITTKNDVLRIAIKLGLKELDNEYSKNKIKS